MHATVLIFLTFIAWAVFGTPPMVMTRSWWEADQKLKGILPDIELDTLYSSPLLTSTRKRCTFTSVLEERRLQLILYSHFQCTTENYATKCGCNVPGNLYAVCLKGFNTLVRNGEVYAVYFSPLVTIHKTCIHIPFHDSYCDWNILHKRRKKEFLISCCNVH